MLIAIPTDSGKMSGHFGHAPQFNLFKIDDRKIIETRVLDAPPHQPGLLPKWLKEQGVDIVIAGNIGSKARAIFEQNGIEVVYGVGETDPDTIVSDFIKGELKNDAEVTCCH